MASDPAIDLWAMDEVHFQQHGSRCRMWIPPEVRDPVVLHEPTRKGVGYFGAVRLRDGHFASLDDLIATVESQFDIWAQPNDVLRRLCTIT